MWFLLFRRVRMMIIGVVLRPVVASIARRLAERAERLNESPTVGSRGLRVVESTARRARSVLR